MVKITKELLDEFESEVLSDDPYYINGWDRKHPDKKWSYIKKEILKLAGIDDPPDESYHHERGLVDRSLLLDDTFSEPNKGE